MCFIEEEDLNVGVGVEETNLEGDDSLNDVLVTSENKSEVGSLSSDAKAALRATLEAIEAGKDDASLEGVTVPIKG